MGRTQEAATDHALTNRQRALLAKRLGPRGDKLRVLVEEADPKLIDALRELTSELEELNRRIVELSQGMDELRGEMIARGGDDALDD